MSVNIRKLGGFSAKLLGRRGFDLVDRVDSI
jgi:hypothetical protein